MLKIVAWPMKEGTCFLLVFHHLLADGRGALGLARELADCYAAGEQPGFAEEKLIASVDEFPKNSRMPFISRFMIGRANKNQAKEQRILYPAGFPGYPENSGRPDGERTDDRVHQRKIKKDTT